MKENRSLEISLGLQSINSNDILEKLNQFIYIDFSNYLKNTKNRNRIFSLENTYKLMILGAYEKDKSLTNCLNLFKQNFDFNNSLKIEEEKIKLLQEEIEYKKLTKLKRGRPKKFKSKIIKSHYHPKLFLYFFLCFCIFFNKNLNRTHNFVVQQNLNYESIQADQK